MRQATATAPPKSPKVEPVGCFLELVQQLQHRFWRVASLRDLAVTRRRRHTKRKSKQGAIEVVLELAPKEEVRGKLQEASEGGAGRGGG